MGKATGFVLFDTAIGRCGIAWGREGIVGVQLPESREADTRARMLRHAPDAPEGAPPPDVGKVVDGIVALLRGESPDLTTAPLDMSDVAPFARRVYDIARTIPPGRTLTYGDVAARAGAPGSARAVGRALGDNPFPILVPCHRVVAAGGKAGGFSGSGGVATKIRMLAIEGPQRTLPIEGPPRR